MALCGYNEEIGKGLNSLIRGMVSSIEEKAAKAGSMQAIDQELYELDEMISGLEGQGPAQELFAGINMFARKFFTEVKRELTVDPERSIRFIMEELGQKFILTLKGSEEYRLSLDEAALVAEGKVPIKMVTEWANQFADKVRPFGF